MSYSNIQKQDIDVLRILQEEDTRQHESLELIASENFVSRAVLEACHSTFTNKYAEGYPGKRYYGGCINADKIELLAIERLKKLFSAKYANVQPHSGSQANMAAYFAFLKPGDTILGMDLSHGGHLTHGSRVNFSGLYYNVISYGVRQKDHYIDYDQISRLAHEYKPKLIIAGASAYPRFIDFAQFRAIADEVNAYLLADIAHIAGLIAAGLHLSPMEYAHCVTSTTHKTLRGPRGGIILSNVEEHGRKIDSKIFPGIQGGPLLHVIASKAVAFQEAMEPSFATYQHSVIHNAKELALTLIAKGFQVVSGGTDNHLLLVDTFASNNITGKDAQNILEEVGITVNKNTLPFDIHPPAISSGIRLGTAALTTRGFQESEFRQIGDWIVKLLSAPNDAGLKEAIRNEVLELCSQFPMDNFCLV